MKCTHGISLNKECIYCANGTEPHSVSASVSNDLLCDDDKKIYPCDDCGKMRSKNEGGTTFTVCDDCWSKHFGDSLSKTVT
jgi:hypothetical protein